MFEKTILPNLAEKAGSAPPSSSGGAGGAPKGRYDSKRLASYGVSAEEAAAAETYESERRAARGED